MRNLFGIRKENLSSKNGAGGKTMRNLFGIRKENLSSEHGAGGKTMRNLFGMGKEHLNSDEGERTMSKTLGIRWLAVAAGAAMLLVLGAACTKEIEVPGETIIVEKEIIKTVEVPGETIVVEKEVVKTVEVPGQTVVVEKEVVKEVVKTVAGPERVVVREVPGKNYVTDPTNGKAVTAPEYGGTLTMSKSSGFPPTADPYFSTAWATHSMLHSVLEPLSIADWAIDRDKFDWSSYAVPLFGLRGALAESWDISPDGLTYTIHTRQGVYWHDKRPVNGRELTADDVEYTYHRNLGNRLTGTEFSEAEPTPGLSWDGWDTMPIESITATDKWTVVFKLTRPDNRALRSIIGNIIHFIVAREVIDEYGDMKDWRNVVGTGPWVLTDLVEGSSMTLTKNPNYWSDDEKYPGNRLPYVDELSVKVMPEPATRIAALRSGKIDYAGAPLSYPPALDSIDKVESMQRTNPEIVITEHIVRMTSSFGMNTQRAPFDDIRVRKAMQMALDLETLHYTYFKGWGTWGPQGLIANDVPLAGTAFEEWPEEVKKGYMYDPAGAEKLLDEAGYQRGADGIRFKASLVWHDKQDPSFIELLAATYYRDIGVDVEIELVPGAELGTRKKARDWDMINNLMADTGTWPPFDAMAQYKTGAENNWANLNDPVYDAMLAAAEKVSTEEEQLLLVKELNMYAIERHWVVFAGNVIPWTTVTQPWVKGYNGELKLGGNQFEYTIAARLWIDQEMKEAMGY